MENKKEKFDISLNFLTLSLKHLSLVRNVLEENIKQGNLHFLISDREISEEEYDQRTRWSDFNIFPVLFNFYHGLELLMKGFLILVDNYEVKPIHDFEKLLNDFRSYYPSKKISDILTKYIEVNQMPQLLSEWVEENKINISQLHELLEYPFDKTFNKKINYLKLKYQQDKGLSLAKQFVNDIENLQKESVRLYRSLEATIN